MDKDTRKSAAHFTNEGHKKSVGHECFNYNNEMFPEPARLIWPMAVQENATKFEAQTASFNVCTRE